MPTKILVSPPPPEFSCLPTALKDRVDLNLAPLSENKRCQIGLISEAAAFYALHACIN